MKNTKARDNSGDDWKTPDWFYNKLNKYDVHLRELKTQGLA